MSPRCCDSVSLFFSQSTALIVMNSRVRARVCAAFFFYCASDEIYIIVQRASRVCIRVSFFINELGRCYQSAMRLFFAFVRCRAAFINV